MTDYKHILFLVLLGVLVAGTQSWTQASSAEPRFASLVPGIRITRLPFDLTNIDSLDYARDGRLFAAGYDGRIHVLSDSDGDGIEDQADLFWSDPGDLLTPVGILATDGGLYVASRGKIALIRDTDGDGRGDVSEAVVTGWVKEKYNGDTRNDAAGVAIDDKGFLYFSLGCMSYNKAWLLDDEGKSHYEKSSERGAILKVSPDRKHREILATGLRFVVALEFNEQGDLFATDQEGDTWFPGGNPRDELLHILPNRHYGFPFRHAKYLPDSVDEPSVVDFSPQHQSTCGFRFNDSRSGRRAFGPKHWQGNAIVTGFSRGKLWRVPLAKSRAGYVGKQIQFAAFESLLTDVAISPTGDLLLTGHGGRPDWGSGPGSNGHLYKIQADDSVAQPVVAWPSSPLKVKVAFDRPVETNGFVTPTIQIGDFAWEGDQHEWIYPGYEVVETEKQSVRRSLAVRDTNWSDDRRTLTLTTQPQPWRSRYVVRTPASDPANSRKTSNNQRFELSYDLSGVQAQWTPRGKTQPQWTGWLPHHDWNVVSEFTKGSAEHERLRALVQRPGELKMQSLLRIPGQQATLRWEASAPFHVNCGDQTKTSQVQGGHSVLEMSIQGDPAESATETRGARIEITPRNEVRLEITVETGGQAFAFDASFQADFDPHSRPLRLEHLFVPWAPTLRPTETSADERELVRQLPGDPTKGREIFFGKEANCAACHKFRGKGSDIAADLSVTVHRHPKAVLQDIIDPSSAINPDYVSYTVLANDGRVLTGLFQSADNDRVTLVDNQAKAHTIPRSEIQDIRASSVSMMPTGFDKLGEENLQDLVAFLCSVDEDAKQKGLPTGVLTREYWDDLPDGDVSALRAHKNFPEHPSGSQRLGLFEGPVNWKEHYGARIHGYVHPPETGDYTFWMAADDYAELWISSNENPRDKKQLLAIRRWTPSRVWEKYPEQKSKPIRLEAGRRYYIEALQTEGRVDDCLAVGWQLPDGTYERPIPGKRLSSYQ